MIWYAHLSFPSNQIAKFFDHQFLLKEFIYILVFWYRVSHQGLVHLQLSVLVEFSVTSCVCCLIKLQDSLISNITGKNQLILKNQLLSFLDGDTHQGKVASKATTLGWVSPILSLVHSDSGIH